MRLTLAVLVVLGMLAGLAAAYNRFHVEERNRRITLALDWPEVTQLAQSSGHSVSSVLARFKAAHVDALVISEDTLLSLQEAGAIQPQRVAYSAGGYTTRLSVDSARTLKRLLKALAARGMHYGWATERSAPSPAGTTEILCPPGASPKPGIISARVAISYANLRPIGVGLPPDAVAAAQAAHLYIAGRIGNFAGVSPTSAEQVLVALRKQGARIVFFNGDEVLGYKGVEDQVAKLLNSHTELQFGEQASNEDPDSPTGLTYGAVEFSKQRGEERLSGALHGDYIRVHAIQQAEMATMEEPDVIERFVLAARERNIRFCFIRLFTFAGDDPVGANVELVNKIATGIEKKSALTGGEFVFDLAHRFTLTHVPGALFAVLGLGTAAGIVWAASLLLPLSDRAALRLLIGAAIVCMGLALYGEPGQTDIGRKLVALLAGIAFPLAACARTYPRRGMAGASLPALIPRGAAIAGALKGLALASAITGIGIIHVVGLLATRPFMLRADQFLGIKAQHAIPVVIIALVALTGGIAAAGETWASYRDRIVRNVRALLDEPARFGTLLFLIVGVVALAIVLSRTGNDTSVGASGIELKFRTLLDRVLPVRPRTKEFLIGHPAFVLALAWWFRGRRRLAIPMFVVGCIGQVSLLNTFCHIHTPLLVSVWRACLGLVFGAAIGLAVFLALEMVLPAPAAALELADASDDGRRPAAAPLRPGAEPPADARIGVPRNA